MDNWQDLPAGYSGTGWLNLNGQKEESTAASCENL